MFNKTNRNRKTTEIMESLFIKYDQALELKELGFDEPCFGCYDEKGVFGLTVMSIKQYYTNSKEDTWNCSAPLYQQEFRLFREKYDLFGCIDLQACTPSHWYIRIDKIEINDYLYHSEDEHLRFNTYEEAELSCLEKLIEIVKSNTKSP